MKMRMNKRVANLPSIARYGGNKKRLICMSLRAPTTIATSFIKIGKVVVIRVCRNWWQWWQAARTVTSTGQRIKKSCARLVRTSAYVM